MRTTTGKSDPVELLKIFAAGSLSVNINGLPFLKVDAESRSVGIEMEGMIETGLKLSNLGTAKRHPTVASLVKTSFTTAKGLSEIGWRLSLNERGSPVLAMGRGVSRLTGHVTANPLRLRRLTQII